MSHIWVLYIDWIGDIQLQLKMYTEVGKISKVEQIVLYFFELWMFTMEFFNVVITLSLFFFPGNEDAGVHGDVDGEEKERDDILREQVHDCTFSFCFLKFKL